MSYPPSHPLFDRRDISDSAYIELLLFEIKELRAECDSTKKKLHELIGKRAGESYQDSTISYENSDGIPQRSARRRKQVEQVPQRSSVEQPDADTIPKSEPHPDVVTNSVPISENIKSGLSLVVKRSTSPNSLGQNETDFDSLGKKEDDNLKVAEEEKNNIENSPLLRAVSPSTDSGGSQDDSIVQAKNRTMSQGESSRTVAQTSVNPYNMRIKLPHTMRGSENSIITNSHLAHIEDRPSPGNNEERRSSFSIPTNTSFGTRSESSSASHSSNKLSPVLNDFSYRTDLRGGEEALNTPQSPATVSQAQSMQRTSPASHGSSFQVLTSPEPQDDVILFLKPEDFLTIKIEVISTLSFNPKKSEDFSCTLSINDRESGKGMWKVRKSFNQILSFDNEIRLILEAFGLPPLPDKGLFTSTVPAKVDARKTALQHYFNSIFLIPHIPQMILYRICRYISLDFVNPLDDFRSGAKLEGYLIRRYKGLGTTWKIRWCQVDGPSLEIYEFPGGPMIEQVRLQGSQIGRQSTDNVAEEKGYRHAFLILEAPKNKISSSTQKHFFCAESDKERDEWVNAMVEYTENDPIKALKLYPEAVEQRKPPKPQEASLLKQNALNKEEEQLKDPKDVKKLRKRSLFPFRYKGQLYDTDDDSGCTPEADLGGSLTLESHLASMDLTHDRFTPVFGNNLTEAVSLSSKVLDGKQIPTVCFRCIDYLSRTGAIYEEGIFRLSGSASTIRLIKDQFNRELDVNLFDHHLKPDIHTVAGLFKTYLRELPSSIFGENEYVLLQRIISDDKGIMSKSQLAIQIRNFINHDVSKSPVNYDFCFTVFRLLKAVVDQSSTNLMTLKNICIVFVPTLRVSLDILSLCITDFDCIFMNGRPMDDDKREPLDLQIPSF